MVGTVQAAPCPPEGRELSELLALPATGFAIDTDEERNRLARDLVACVGHPDPAVRDGLVFGAYGTWLRGGQLSGDTIVFLLEVLSEQLTAVDEDGFLNPFAALNLSEVARSDRITPLLKSSERDTLVGDAAGYLAGVRDYRGFANGEGWRHGVAHGADLALQLTLNSNVDAQQVARLLDSVLRQIRPDGEVFYTFGEPARLARPAFYAYMRDDLEAEFWDAWFVRLLDPEPLASWEASWQSRAGLARRHNLQGFLRALYIMADSSDQAAALSLKARADRALRAL
jgi:hypothetical protein